MSRPDTTEGRIRADVEALRRELVELRAAVVRSDQLTTEIMVRLAQSVCEVQDQVSMLAHAVAGRPQGHS